MKLAPQTHQNFEEFFRDFFEETDLNLPQIQIYIKKGSLIVTRVLGVDGITIGRRVFIKPALAEIIHPTSFKIGKKLLAHELTHVLQYKKLGFIGFLLSYFSDYFLGLMRKKRLNNQARMEAYWEISYEIEARKAAREFEKWFQFRKKNNG